MAVFLAGGAGYIGSHMAVELLNRGFDVVIGDNFSNSNPKVLDRIRLLTGRKFVYYNCDLREDEALDTIFSENKIDYIVHLAGHKAAGESVDIPVEYYSNNLRITIALCEAMKRHAVSKLIFSSSACVYSSDNNMPLVEDAKVGECPNPYGWTKFMSEQILCDGAKANPSWSVVILRYFNLIGAHESGELGEAPMDKPKNLPPIIAQVASGKMDHLDVFGNDYPTKDGSCVRDYIHVMDLVEGHIAAMKYSDKNYGVHVFNLGTGEGTSVFELISMFEKTTGRKIPYSISSRRNGDLPISFCSPCKALSQLGWKPKRTVMDGCIDTWRWQQKNPFGY